MAAAPLRAAEVHAAYEQVVDRVAVADGPEVDEDRQTLAVHLPRVRKEVWVLEEGVEDVGVEYCPVLESSAQNIPLGVSVLLLVGQVQVDLAAVDEELAVLLLDAHPAGLAGGRPFHLRLAERQAGRGVEVDLDRRVATLDLAPEHDQSLV